jgi:hypothetical protein
MEAQKSAISKWESFKKEVTGDRAMKYCLAVRIFSALYELDAPRYNKLSLDLPSPLFACTEYFEHLMLAYVFYFDCKSRVME